jgi:2-keto-4-pentenoate hydratase
VTISTSPATEATVAAVADALRAAESTRVPVGPPSASHPELDVAAAYAIQGRNVARRLARGERIVGRKIGLTSEAMQRQLGVDQPDYGVIFDTMVVENGGRLETDMLIAPRVEAEFAFLIGGHLPPSPTLEELTRAVVGVAVALEIIDSRIADWKIGLVDTIADNASSAGIACGEFLPILGERLASLPEAVISLSRDGVEVESGPGAAVLGDPLLSLHWLAMAIGEYGDCFSNGEIVLAGAVAAAIPLVAGSNFTASADGFPSVTIDSVDHDEETP